ncbi:PfkB family carbohydrate kinase [Stenotrophobium rhamnosiphilum]|uniref:Carbohydrate kinase PfkB domain-containing protein n=1 Tax=Stenotrophobium rhamnosiphilum TaxID=2029166 RepID=A0A2T5MCQ1_9GAMM|nr:PfkB family carbohydrate kinase [Stenotrophobium rhamnosiphilum]PTU30327.1 hypothetical protein CJD38_15385 [Stenotrophobium rhamnosiphilum]
MTIQAPRIAGAGLFAVDVLVGPDGDVSKCSLGGSAGNVLAILGSLGWGTSPIGMLGDDSAADMLQDEFSAIGADLTFMRRSDDRRTPVVYQHQLSQPESHTHRFSFTCPCCGTRRKPQWDLRDHPATYDTELPSASVFFLDRPTESGIAMAQHYAELGGLVVFEPSEIGSDVALFRKALQYSHIVKYADDRINGLEDFDTSSVIVEIQTRGPRGLRFKTANLHLDWFELGAYALPTHKRDTAGAGDWCTAGLIYKLFNDGVSSRDDVGHESLLNALAFGQALSAFNCMTEGARGLLDAWRPEKIVEQARELSSLRLSAMLENQIAPSSPMSEDFLVRLVDDSIFAQRKSHLSTNNFLCCL